MDTYEAVLAMLHDAQDEANPPTLDGYTVEELEVEECITIE